MNIDLEYNKQIEVSKALYDRLYTDKYAKSVLAFKSTGSQYFIKLWNMAWKEYVEKIINSNGK